MKELSNKEFKVENNLTLEERNILSYTHKTLNLY
jgi:hypothetical protein